MTKVALISDLHFGKFSRTDEFAVIGEHIKDLRGVGAMIAYAFCSRSFSCIHKLTRVSADTPRRWAISWTSSDSVLSMA